MNSRKLAVGSLVVAAASLGGIGIAYATGGTPVEVGKPDTAGGYNPHPSSAPQDAATIQTDRGAYRVKTFAQTDGGVCIEVVEGPNDSTGSCGRVPDASHPFGPRIADVRQGAGDRLVVGVARGDVMSVDVTTSAGTDRVQTVPRAAAQTRTYVAKLRNGGESSSIRLAPLKADGTSAGASQLAEKPR